MAKATMDRFLERVETLLNDRELYANSKLTSEKINCEYGMGRAIEIITEMGNTN